MKTEHLPVIELDVDLSYRVCIDTPVTEMPKRGEMFKHVVECAENDIWVKTLGVEAAPHPFYSLYTIRIRMSDKHVRANLRKLIAANVMFIIDRYLRASIPEIPDDEDSIDYNYAQTFYYKVEAEDD